MDLYRKHRPIKLGDVVGQDKAVRILAQKLTDKTYSHTSMLMGPSGCGKTTLARIIARMLGCGDSDLTEINCADVRGIDSVRDIASVMNLSPLSGDARVWILDEVVQLPKATQQAFLKVLEDTPPRAYFILCTTDTSGLLPTFTSRCFGLTLESLTSKAIDSLLARVVEAEKATIDEDVLQAIQNTAAGNGRKALQLLEAALACRSTKEALAVVGESGVEKQVGFVANLLLKRADWKEVMRSIDKVEHKDLEGLRLGVLAYAGKVLANSRSPQAKRIISCFRDPWDRVGKAGLIEACYDCLGSK